MNDAAPRDVTHPNTAPGDTLPGDTDIRGAATRAPDHSIDGATVGMNLDSFPVGELGVGPWVSPIRLAPSAAPSRCEVLIVGAGLTGLSTALLLAERHRDVVVVDREFGSGATVRSGGIVLGDTLGGPSPAFEGCERSLAEWIERQRVECDLTWSGCLELDRDAGLSATPIDWIDSGPVRLAAVCAGGMLDPVKLLNAMLETARRTGVRVIGGVHVRRVMRDSAGMIAVEGDDVRIGADRVVLAADALSWSAGSPQWPWSHRTITVVLQTTELDPRTLPTIGLYDRQPFYTRELPLLWGRPLPDGSFMFGRELLSFPEVVVPGSLKSAVQAAGERLLQRVRRLHPGLSDVAVRRVWAGATARTASGIPTLTEDPNVAGVVWVGGYGGHGLAQSFRLGGIAADWLERRLD